MSVETFFKKNLYYILIGLLFLILTVVAITPLFKINKSLKSFWNTEAQGGADLPAGWEFIEKRSPYEIISCNFGLVELENVIVYTNTSGDYFSGEFYDITRSNIFSQKWTVKNNGSFNIYNTTFEDIVSGLEADCNKFKTSQEGEGVNWDSFPSRGVYEPSAEMQITNQTSDSIISSIITIKTHQFSLKMIEEGKKDEYRPEWSDEELQAYIDLANKEIKELIKQIESTGTSLDTWAELYKEQIKEGLPFEEE